MTLQKSVNFHLKCFVCNQCGKPIDGRAGTKDGKLYCAEDYKQLFVKKCFVCGEFIVQV